MRWGSYGSGFVRESTVILKRVQAQSWKHTVDVALNSVEPRARKSHKKIKLNESAVLSFQLPAGIWNLGTRSNRRLCLMSPSLVYLQLIFSPFMWRFKVAKCRGLYKVSNEYRFSVQHHELSSAWLTAVFISAKNSVFCTGSWHFWHSAGWQRSDYMMLF